jgi:hypothetical protein
LLTGPQAKKQLHVPDTAGSASQFLPMLPPKHNSEKIVAARERVKTLKAQKM